MWEENWHPMAHMFALRRGMENTTPVSLIACVTRTHTVEKDTQLTSATTKQRESLMLGVILLSFSFGFFCFLCPASNQPTNTSIIPFPRRTRGFSKRDSETVLCHRRSSRPQSPGDSDVRLLHPFCCPWSAGRHEAN